MFKMLKEIFEPYIEPVKMPDFGKRENYDDLERTYKTLDFRRITNEKSIIKR